MSEGGLTLPCAMWLVQYLLHEIWFPKNLYIDEMDTAKKITGIKMKHACFKNSYIMIFVCSLFSA